MQKLSEEKIGYGVMVILVLVSFLSAELACSKIKRRRGVVCLASSGIYLGSLFSITALFFGGQYGAVSETVFLVMLGGGLAMLMDSGKKNMLKNRYKVKQ